LDAAVKVMAVPGGGRLASVVTVDSSDLDNIRKKRGARQPANLRAPVDEPVIIAALSLGTTTAGHAAPDAAPKVHDGMLPKQVGHKVGALTGVMKANPSKSIFGLARLPTALDAQFETPNGFPRPKDPVKVPQNSGVKIES